MAKQKYTPEQKERAITFLRELLPVGSRLTFVLLDARGSNTESNTRIYAVLAPYTYTYDDRKGGSRQLTEAIELSSWLEQAGIYTRSVGRYRANGVKSNYADNINRHIGQKLYDDENAFIEVKEYIGD